MHSSGFSLVDKLVDGAFRVFALVVLALLLLFPAYKRNWLGYVPLMAAAVAIVGLPLAFSARHTPWRRPIELISRLRDSSFLTCVLVGAFIVQLGLILSVRSQPESDSLFVVEQARSFVTSGAMPWRTYYPPAQIWWYALAFRLVADSTLVAQLANIPLVLVCIALTYALARRYVPTQASRLVTIGLALYPTFQAYVLTTPYYYYLQLSLVLLCLLALSSGDRDDSSWGAPLLAGIFGGMAALAQPFFLLSPLLAAGYWLRSGGSDRLRLFLTRTTMFALGLTLVLTPWTIRNYQVFDAFVPICTSGGLVFYSANNPQSNGLYSNLPDLYKPTSPHDALRHSRECWNLGWAFIREQPRHFMRLVALKNLHTWGNEATFATQVNVKGRPVRELTLALSALSQFAWALLVLSWAQQSVRSLWGGRPAGEFEHLAATFVCLTALTFSLFEGGSRHHLLCVPVLLIYLGERLHRITGD
jgi:hypothetical protein